MPQSNYKEANQPARAQPVHPRSPIRIFVIRCPGSIIHCKHFKTLASPCNQGNISVQLWPQQTCTSEKHLRAIVTPANLYIRETSPSNCDPANLYIRVTSPCNCDPADLYIRKTSPCICDPSKSVNQRNISVQLWPQQTCTSEKHFRAIVTPANLYIRETSPCNCDTSKPVHQRFISVQLWPQQTCTYIVKSRLAGAYLSLVTRKHVFGSSDQVRFKPTCSAS